MTDYEQFTLNDAEEDWRSESEDEFGFDAAVSIYDFEEFDEDDFEFDERYAAVTIDFSSKPRAESCPPRSRNIWS